MAKTNARARRRAAKAQAWSKDEALRRLGPCPAVPEYCRIGGDSPNPRAEAQWIGKQRDCRSAVARRKAWLKRRDEIEEQDRRHRAVLEAPRQEDATIRDVATGVAVNAFDKDRGTPQRANRDLGLHQEDIADPTPSNRSRKRTVTRATDTLRHLLANKDIGRGHHRAGRRFERDFAKAQLDRIAIASVLRVGGGGGRRGGSAIDDARADIGQAIRAMGGEGSSMSSVMWFVIGQNHSIAEWCRRMTMGHGKAMNPHLAKGFLIAALEVLHQHYFAPARSSNDGREAA